MSYLPSERMSAKMTALHALPGIREALAFLEQDQENSILEQISIAEIEAPTFHEEGRAKFFVEKLESLGLQNPVVREDGNVTALIPGVESGIILIEAHMDTVFPFGTVKEIRRENGVLYGPGIYDNARGMAALLAMLRALNISGLRPRKSILVAGTVQEEVPGGNQGIANLLDDYPELEASISADGGFIEGISYRGSFSTTVIFTFHGIGGHARNGFGRFANPLNAACRAVEKISGIHVPPNTQTTYSATRIVVPEECSIGSFPGSCELYIDYSSQEKEPFEKLGAQIEECVMEACCEETRRWGADTIRYTRKVYSYTPGGEQDIHAPIIEAHYLAGKSLGLEPYFWSGLSNGNIPISRSIPAVTAGSGGVRRYMKGHSLEELFPEKDAYHFPQGLLLLLLMVAGVYGSIHSCLEEEGDK